jgi:hypothetical protein
MRHELTIDVTEDIVTDDDLALYAGDAAPKRFTGIPGMCFTGVSPYC